MPGAARADTNGKQHVMADAVLTVNAGSSSIKFAVFDTSSAGLRAVSHGPAGVRAMSHGQIEGIGETPHFTARDAAGASIAEHRWPDGEHQSHEELFGVLLDWVDGHLGRDAVIAVGHRVVHGGPRFDRPMRVTGKLLRALDALSPLAPLHQPHNLSPIRAIAASRPDLPQVVCFDTAFHHDMPAVATRVALPRAYAAEGVRRYGFHGLSYEYIAGELAELAPDAAGGRVIAAHLGNGASLCAMRAGRSVDSTMGFSALDGLVMGTRCGTIDPGILLYLQQRHAMTTGQVEQLLYREAGLLGVSGVSGDMRDLLGSDVPAAREAIELFIFRLAREAGGLISSLGGLDALVFTAGIGEHAPEIRAAAGAALGWAGVAMDDAANMAGDAARLISRADSRVAVWVIPTNEEVMIARHTLGVIDGPAVAPTGVEGER
jgi:acetate kinase